MEKREAGHLLPVKYQYDAGEIVCVPDAEGHCLTCSDEALPARTISIDQEMGVARVMIKNEEQEVDITLVEEVVPGDWLLVHGGVAMAHLTGGEFDEAHHAR